MRVSRMLSVVLLMLAPLVAQAQDGVRVARGEDAAFTLGVEGTPSHVTVRQAGALTPYEIAVGTEFVRGDHKDAIGPNGIPARDDGTRPAAPRPVAGMVRARFTTVPGTDHSLLVIENGYDRALVYKAVMFRNGAHPTDVCLVMPGKVGLEHWPYPIDAIEMRANVLVPWTPADGIRCE